MKSLFGTGIFLSGTVVTCQRLCSHSGGLCSALPERYTAIKSRIFSVYNKLQHRAQHAKFFFFLSLIHKGNVQCIRLFINYLTQQNTSELNGEGLTAVKSLTPVVSTLPLNERKTGSVTTSQSKGRTFNK